MGGNVWYQVRATTNSPVTEEVPVRARVVTTGPSTRSSDSKRTSITTTPVPIGDDIITTGPDG